MFRTVLRSGGGRESFRFGRMYVWRIGISSGFYRAAGATRASSCDGHARQRLRWSEWRHRHAVSYTINEALETRHRRDRQRTRRRQFQPGQYQVVFQRPSLL